MRVITESDALTLGGTVLALSEKLYSKKRAEQIALKKCDEHQPLLCEYKIKIKSGRTVKRYLPLAIVIE
jgi:hypothetical protein